MNQRELEALAERVVDEWEDVEDESLREGHRATLERLIAAAAHRAVESAVSRAVEKACKALAADDFRASDCDPGYTHAQWVIRRALSPASSAEEKRQESKP